MILNIDEYWGMTVALNPAETTGERLNDTLFERAGLIESRYNCRLIDDAYAAGKNLGNMSTYAGKILSAGDDTYDVMFIPDASIAKQASAGNLRNLRELEPLHLDSPWWDDGYNSTALIGDSLYGACGDGYLMAYDSSWCLFFNKDMMADRSMAFPYDTVREGKWTYDALYGTISQCAELNGDEDWNWKQGGAAVYGLVTHDHAPDKFILGADLTYVSRVDGALVWTAENERFYTAVERLAAMLSEKGTTLQGNTDDFNPDRGYVYTFMNNRAVFLTAEVKTAMRLREMESSFGIVPFPKLDESQENYRTAVMSNMMIMTIPAVSSHAEETAAVMDAFYYEGMRTVVPVYFDITVSMKGLRDNDSVEMLGIIRDGRLVDISVLYGWNSSVCEQIRRAVFSGNTEAASILAKNKKVVESQVKKYVEEFGG